LEDAARRALDEARAAVSALTLGTDEPFPAALAAAAEDVTLRSGARLEVELPVEPFDVSLEARQALMRIVREAVANATRHGRAETVRLSVERVARVGQAPMLRVRVADDGSGFDVPDALAARRGFGLKSITERAEGLGGTVHITSAAGAGTQVEVVVACA
jgi:signal transduction histidine kinase